VLVYANGDWEGVAFRDELDRLEGRLNLTAELLARHLPDGYRRFQFFICGPGPMMGAAEAALLSRGVPAERVHTERFDMV
jgi:ferredoxin-NADP reductase